MAKTHRTGMKIGSIHACIPQQGCTWGVCVLGGGGGGKQMKGPGRSR